MKKKNFAILFRRTMAVTIMCMLSSFLIFSQNITVKGSGQQQFSAQIIVTGTKTVFATGAYSVLCDITVK